MNRFAAFFAMTFAGFFSLRAEPLPIGSPAPALSALDENGKSVNLGELYAKGLTLVYFYPKASTPGCTAQACSLRDGIVDLKRIGVNVVGVSHDTPAAQKAFKEKYELPFTLIADADGKVIAAFGVPTIPLVGLAKRQSFLVRDGRIAWYSPAAQTATHAKEVEAAVAALK